MPEIFTVRFSICGVGVWHLNTSFVPSLRNLMLRTFEFDRAKNWVHLNLTVQNTGSSTPPNSFSAAGKKFTTLGNCFLFVLFFLDFIQLKSSSIYIR